LGNSWQPEAKPTSGKALWRYKTSGAEGSPQA
jgi:hypothetical protein